MRICNQHIEWVLKSDSDTKGFLYICCPLMKHVQSSEKMTCLWVGLANINNCPSFKSLNESTATCAWGFQGNCNRMLHRNSEKYNKTCRGDAKFGGYVKELSSHGAKEFSIWRPLTNVKKQWSSLVVETTAGYKRDHRVNHTFVRQVNKWSKALSKLETEIFSTSPWHSLEYHITSI